MPDGPVAQGYVLPPIIPSVSEAAPVLRQSAIEANPGSHELRVKPRAVIDQGNLPCCISCAFTSAMETLNPATPPLSSIFHYHVTRYDCGGADSNGYLYIDDARRTLENQGITRLDLYSVSFTDAGAATTPSTEAYADALSRAFRPRAGLFRRDKQIVGPSRLAAIRDELAQDHPVVIGIQLPVSYPASFLNPQFQWLDPDTFQRSSVGHFVLAIGYDDSRSCIHIQDSRGNRSFENGLWWMGYRVADSSIIQDAYSLVP